MCKTKNKRGCQGGLLSDSYAFMTGQLHFHDRTIRLSAPVAGSLLYCYVAPCSDEIEKHLYLYNIKRKLAKSPSLFIFTEKGTRLCYNKSKVKTKLN